MLYQLSYTPKGRPRAIKACRVAIKRISRATGDGVGGQTRAALARHAP